MSWEGIIIGEVTLSKKQFDNWFDLEIHEGMFDDWPEDLIGAEVPDTTVKAVLEDAQRSSRESAQYIKFWIEGEKAHIRAILDGDSYGVWIGMIATSLRAAGMAEGEAEIIFGDALSEEGHLMLTTPQQTTFEEIYSFSDKKKHRKWLDEAWQEYLSRG
jgi:hypothetical protein